ncbi:MAG: response regulator transcription factor [Flammeovirgaceae bacterium]|nr:response regulator transcription factor [Flammeovirgaceae bacterium]
MIKKLKVYIADDHSLFRKAMVALIKTLPRVSEVKDAENGRELLALVKQDPPDVCVVDLQMPVMDGEETTTRILSSYPNVKVIILTMEDHEKLIIQMIERGAHAFLHKTTNPDELEKAINSVVDKDFYHNDLVASAMRRNLKDKSKAKLNEELSDREINIIKFVCDELTNKEIGEKLSLSERTIETHRSRIMEKLNLKTAIGLVKYAYEQGIVE